MRKSFYFYDLETSGLESRDDRIMQFAGIRTDENFNIIGEPTNVLVTLTDDILPSPGAILVTGITPNMTRMDGMSEREFCRFLTEEISTAGTTILGYNSIRFDDEFMRNTLWRNFYDPYEWQWKDGRSRWDLLDVVRMTRALRPDGIEWPVTEDGKPTNRLELITKCNNISHENAHDALADVEALISVTRLIKEKQPQLFDYLFSIRSKDSVSKIVDPKNPRAFVYSSGRYGPVHNFTTVAYPLVDLGTGQVLIFDLRYNVDELIAQENAADKTKPTDSSKSFLELEPWERDYFPIFKKLHYNRCPAVAPLGVLAKNDGWKRIDFDEETLNKNLVSLKAHPEFVERVMKLPGREFENIDDVETKIYEGFLGKADSNLCAVIRSGEVDDLRKFHPKFKDKRMGELYMHYKGRNFPEALDEKEAQDWQKYRRERLGRREKKFLKEMQECQEKVSKGESVNGRSREDLEYLLQELQLWYQNSLEVE